MEIFDLQIISYDLISSAAFNFIVSKYEKEYIQLQKRRNNQFPKEIKHEGVVYHYNMTLLLSEGRCKISDAFFELSGDKEIREDIFCCSNHQRIIHAGDLFFLIQPKYDQVSLYDSKLKKLERPSKAVCPRFFSKGQLAFPITNIITGKTVFPKNSKKEKSELSNSKKIKYGNRISANAKLVEEMNKLKVRKYLKKKSNINL